MTVIVCITIASIGLAFAVRILMRTKERRACVADERHREGEVLLATRADILERRLIAVARRLNDLAGEERPGTRLGRKLLARVKDDASLRIDGAIRELATARVAVPKDRASAEAALDAVSVSVDRLTVMADVWEKVVPGLSGGVRSCVGVLQATATAYRQDLEDLFTYHGSLGRDVSEERRRIRILRNGIAANESLVRTEPVKALSRLMSQFSFMNELALRVAARVGPYGVDPAASLSEARVSDDACIPVADDIIEADGRSLRWHRVHDLCADVPERLIGVQQRIVAARAACSVPEVDISAALDAAKDLESAMKKVEHDILAVCSALRRSRPVVRTVALSA